MRILFINEMCGTTSTGRICAEAAQKFESEGNECKIAFGRKNNVPEQYKKFAVRIGSEFDVKMHAIKTRIFDTAGFESKNATHKFLKWADDYNPELIWLHNLHGYYINTEMLFSWIKSKPNIEVKWTLHDCWAFTGHCVHFEMAKCNRWKTGCYLCPNKKEYPASVLFDNSKINYARKKKAFSGVHNLTIITPSKWLANKVKESFLKEYPCEVKHNTIDTNVFKPTPSDFRERYGLKNKFVILGVANSWEKRKGLKDFIKLSEMLSSDYMIVLVGISEKQIKKLPPNIIALERTDNVQELVMIYSAADVYLNLTYEDTFPTTNLESQACGKPVITYRTGGSVESVPQENIIEPGDLETLINLLHKLIKLNN